MKTQSLRRSCAVLFSALLACTFASAQHLRGPIVVKDSKHVVTPRLSDLAQSRFNALEHDAAMAALPVSTVAGLNFDGAKGTGYNYSDVTGAAGATQYVQVINLKYTVYNKTTGAVILGPVNENALWKTFGGACQTTNNGDGTVMYDALAQRWIFQHHAEPAGAQEYFFELDQRPGQGANRMNEFVFHADFSTPANSTFAPVTSFSLPTYRDACSTPCVPQLDTTNKIKATGDRLMAPLVYRNFGDHESILLAHSVSTALSLTAPSAIRWYELRTPLTPVIYQYGTFAPDTNYRWVPSLGMDQMGDIAAGYSVSSATMHPAIRYTGWQSGVDPLGQMEAETSVIEGSGSQQAGNATWSNYSGMSIDPTDDCTFWYTNQYYAADSTNRWNTRIVSFKFPSCSGSN